MFAKAGSKRGVRKGQGLSGVRGVLARNMGGYTQDRQGGRHVRHAVGVRVCSPIGDRSATGQLYLDLSPLLVGGVSILHFGGYCVLKMAS